MSNFFDKLDKEFDKNIIVDIANVVHGDMPGDKVSIDDTHIAKAKTIFVELLDKVKQLNKEKIVISVCGGSGVGKSETASLLSYFFKSMGIGSYTLSGDNYPRRIPMYNDGERLHIFRESAIRGMIKDGTYTKERFDIIHKFQEENMDANKANVENYPWYESYIKNGSEGLAGYLGTDNEIDFKQIESIVKEFKDGKSKIYLKRMGRDAAALWYDEVDFSEINILIIEWTHGNSKNYNGVDIPILLNSTPAETLEHRRLRNRDGGIDSPFTTLVLELEQNLLIRDAHKAKIILSKAGEILSYESYLDLMK
jgi:hypothetical protein